MRPLTRSNSYYFGTKWLVAEAKDEFLASYDSLILRSMITGAVVHRFSEEGRIYDADVLPDGSLTFHDTDGFVVMRQSGGPPVRLRAQADISILAFSPDGRQIIVKDGERVPYLIRADGREFTRLDAGQNCKGLRASGAAWSPDGNTFIVFPDSSSAPCAFDGLTGLPQSELKYPGAQSLVAAPWSSDDSVLMLATQQFVGLWDSRTLTYVQDLKDPAAYTNPPAPTSQAMAAVNTALAVSPDGKRLLTGLVFGAQL